MPLIFKAEDKRVIPFSQPNCECLCTFTFLQWEELQGGFEQMEYLRDILKDHLDKKYDNTTLTEVK